MQDEEKVLKTLNMSQGGGWLIKNYLKKENGAAAAKNRVCTGRSEGVKVLWVGEAKGRGREKIGKQRMVLCISLTVSSKLEVLSSHCTTPFPPPGHPEPYK